MWQSLVNGLLCLPNLQALAMLGGHLVIWLRDVVGSIRAIVLLLQCLFLSICMYGGYTMSALVCDSKSYWKQSI